MLQTIKQKAIPWLFLLPALLMMGAFFILPIGRALYWSVLDYSLIAETGDFVGLKNFEKIFSDPSFWTAVKNTLVFLAIVLPLNVMLPMILAALVNQQIRGNRLYRVLYYFPVITPMVISALVWKSLYAQGGVISQALQFLGLFEGKSVNLLTNPHTALPAVAFITVWKGLGYYMIIYLAGLQNISADIYEAGEMDGANFLQKFFRITLPMLIPSVTLVSIMTIIAGMKVFEEIKITTGGGPVDATTTMVMYIFKHFRQHPSIASAAGIVLLLMSMSASLVQMRINKKREQELGGV